MFDLSLEMLRVVEEAAIASARTMGMGDAKAADQAGVESMRRSMDTLFMNGTIVIGEGERDEAPVLFIGEKVGTRNGVPDALAVDIAVDPWKAPICALPAEPAPSPCWPLPRAADCRTRPIAIWKKS
jgi:fructose-1,6-bisphosphatase/sedoheptulose 1,7-bisphosphatase-like protein